MKNPRDYSDEELNQDIKKLDKKVTRSFHGILGSKALFALALICCLPVGIIAGITWLTILSSALIGVSILGQVGSFAISLNINNKLFDLQNEKSRRAVENVAENKSDIKAAAQVNVPEQKFTQVKSNIFVPTVEDVEEIENTIS